jgi:hypothetical protein
MSVAVDAQASPQPLGAAPAARAFGRLLLVGLLFLPPVRGWFGAAGLDWAYLAALAWAVAFFGVPVARRLAFALACSTRRRPARCTAHPRRCSAASPSTRRSP